MRNMFLQPKIIYLFRIPYIERIAGKFLHQIYYFFRLLRTLERKNPDWKKYQDIRRIKSFN